MKPVFETMKKNAAVNYVDGSTEVSIASREIALLSMVRRRSFPTLVSSFSSFSGVESPEPRWKRFK